ncbi:MAG: DUF5597 domain-containing protein [Brevundimonas sp.]|uniref:GH35 family beta-galactosidase n=1 Tax=Brevundimonas sp. TaxID=1871086 RepID=UPI00273412CA|nr:DUF5597 domain-containing protein [Brevundimonas sp.]MDP3404397.1 DUF5597 domain-containing protein [Brevundimonas sp.]
MPRILILILAACLLLPTLPARAEPLPRLVPHGGRLELLVDDRPFLMLAGELGNSTASTARSMAPHWATLRAAGLNTVLAPVSWELIEPEEGRFDFTSVDDLLAGARDHDQRLVVLWFGAWKNSMSSYVPAWVKRDTDRFPRTLGAGGQRQEILSAFDPATRNADAAAFAALMQHLARVDGVHRTVIMVQVENEIGFLPFAREHGPVPDAAFAGPVPRALIDRMAPGAAGSWAEVFGTGPAGEEIFQAHAYAQYAETVAAAGKAAYPLPMFVNAALNRPGRLPGDYPSAGPLAHLFPVWDLAAPSIDLLTPDIYFENFADWIAPYDRPGEALFVPEANRANRPDTIANALFAIGRHHAIGFSPFSIENITGEPLSRLATAYAHLSEAWPLIAEARGTDRLWGYRAPVSAEGVAGDTPGQWIVGDYVLTLTPVDPWTPREDQDLRGHGALLLQTGPEDLLIIGTGVTITVAARDPARVAGLDNVWLGRFEAGEWQGERLLNGDETHQGRHIRLPPGPVQTQKVRLYLY